MKTRGFLYWLGRKLGDINAVKSGSLRRWANERRTSLSGAGLLGNSGGGDGMRGAKIEDRIVNAVRL